MFLICDKQISLKIGKKNNVEMTPSPMGLLPIYCSNGEPEGLSCVYPPHVYDNETIVLFVILSVYLDGWMDVTKIVCVSSSP